jgi:putative two-component system response regulator
MFVDDERPWLEAIRTAIQEEPSFKIVIADSGEAALHELTRITPDLILSDIRMPFMNGFDLFERVRRIPKCKKVPYVFLSSLDDLDAQRTAKELGADGYLQKPIDSDGVKSIVLDLLVRFKKTEL